ncbi:hypothetical protein L596_029105 [Steinernema carpocapsae]|uniref:Uncharacterized protein n=1 Tax=Steinernema carpocapsae TaxID=34508 RepID=A0A4U5LTN7_STECR|nr:hypothetical protein L596_029105 [Steinernema carpocapsae]
MWLAVIVAIKTLLIVAWITKEYYFFDFTCAIIVNSKYQNDRGPDQVVVRNRRNLIPKTSLFRPSSLIEIRSKRDTTDIDVWWKRFQDDTLQSSPLLTNASRSSENPKRKGKKNKKGRRKKNRKKDSQSAEDHARVTKYPEKRFHLLGGADLNLDLGYASTKTPGGTKWIDGLIDTNDPGFSNKGEIRAYSMKVAKKIPEPDAEQIRNLIKERNATKTEEEHGRVTEATRPPPNFDYPREIPRPFEERRNPEMSTIATQDVSSKPPSETFNPETPIMATTVSYTQNELEKFMFQPRPTPKQTHYVIPPPSVSEDFHPRPLDVVIVKDLGVKTPPPTIRVEYTTPTTLMTRELTPAPTSMPKHKRKENFVIQLNVFTSNALCIARTMTALWCAGQCATLIPFLMGSCIGVKCLLAPHFILDALFLVVVFITSITITVFSLMLYTIVDEMPAPTLLEWIVFAVVLDVILVFYTIAFTISLRCAEILFDKPSTYPSKNPTYQNGSYYVTSPDAGFSGAAREQFV